LKICIRSWRSNRAQPKFAAMRAGRKKKGGGSHGPCCCRVDIECRGRVCGCTLSGLLSTATSVSTGHTRNSAALSAQACLVFSHGCTSPPLSSSFFSPPCRRQSSSVRLAEALRELCVRYLFELRQRTLTPAVHLQLWSHTSRWPVIYVSPPRTAATLDFGTYADERLSCASL
jgi:hypothetical protein